MDEGAEPGTPGFLRNQRRRRDREFIKKYREQEASAKQKLETERARRAYTRKLRQQLAAKERLKQKAQARAALLREKNLRRREVKKLEREEEYQKRIKKEVHTKKRLQQRQLQDRVVPDDGHTVGETETNNNSAIVPATKQAGLSSTTAAGFVRATSRSPASSPLARRRLRRRKSASASPRSRQQTAANKKWMENYRRRQRELEEKKAQAARRRAANVARKERMRALREQEAVRRAHERSKAVVDDKQIQELVEDPLFEERYGLCDIYSIGATTAWDRWEMDVAAFSKSNTAEKHPLRAPTDSYGGVGLLGAMFFDDDNGGETIWDILH